MAVVFVVMTMMVGVQEARVIRIVACSRQWSDHLAAVIGACARSLHLANSLILKSCLTDIDDHHKLGTDTYNCFYST